MESFFRNAPLPFHVSALAAILLLTSFFGSGCARVQELERVNREQAATIQSLHQELARLNKEIEQLLESRGKLGAAKSEMENQLKRELSTGSLTVEMQDKGLVVTVLDRVLFDAGRADLKETAYGTLDKVAAILQEQVPDQIVYIEGHTDNQPIRYSGWRSNWELSMSRAMEVLHYFTTQAGLHPERFAVTGFGEFHPLVENATPEGMMKNRRVEIVVSPKTYARI
jgi:chemotaxis protein MotB